MRRILTETELQHIAATTNDIPSMMRRVEDATIEQILSLIRRSKHRIMVNVAKELEREMESLL